MKFFKSLFALVFILLLSLASQKGNTLALAPSAIQQCGTDTYKSVKYSWCIDRPAQSSNKDILYYMHGAGQHAKVWLEGERRTSIRDEWGRMKVDAPIVVTVSFGMYWHLLDKVQDFKLPLHQVFIEGVIPQIEKKLGGKLGRRFVFGESMGGYNAAMLMLRNGDLFDRVVLGCPAFLPLGPFSTEIEIRDFLQRHAGTVDPEEVQSLLDWEKEEFTTPAQWAANDPLQMSQLLNKQSPFLHISCGAKDEYAFQEGAKIFYDAALVAGVKAQWELIPNGLHCTINGVSIARFLAPEQ